MLSYSIYNKEHSGAWELNILACLWHLPCVALGHLLLYYIVEVFEDRAEQNILISRLSNQRDTQLFSDISGFIKPPSHLAIHKL